MKLAFLIQAHKSFKQLESLLKKIDENDCDIYLHIDLKSKDLYREVKQVQYKFTNLFLINNRKNVIWSGFSQVEATLEMMKLANKKSYDYISLISGEDLIVRPLSEFKKFLKENKGKEFIEFEDIGKKKWRLKKYSFFRENFKNRSLKYRILDNIIRRIQLNCFERKNFKEIKNLYTGSSWFTITGNACSYIIDFIEKNSQILIDFKYTSCADEHFFQIILLNSNFRQSCINDNLRYIKWKSNKSSPEILSLKNYEEIIASKKFIARKFNEKADNQIIQKILGGI